MTPIPLSYPLIRDLAPRIRQADLMDLTIHEGDPEGALSSGLVSGEAYAILDGDTPVGAGGWTVEGAVWSLWTDLSVGQSRALLKLSRPWARIMAIRAKRPLSNVFLKGNTVTERWLRATGCVNILDDTPLRWQGREYIPFYLKPLEDLPYV